MRSVTRSISGDFPLCGYSITDAASPVRDRVGYFAFCLNWQASTILVGSTASPSTCSSTTLPSLSIRNVASWSPTPARIAVFSSICRSTEKIALQIVDFDGSVRGAHQPPQRCTVQNDRAQFERSAADRVADRAALCALHAERRSAQNADDLLCYQVRSPSLVKHGLSRAPGFRVSAS